MAFRSISTVGIRKALKDSLSLRELRFSNRKFRIALVLIAIGVSGRLLLLGLANIETVLVASLLAGSYLGGLYTVLVPVAILLSSDAIVYAARYPGLYPLGDVAILAVFVYSGYVMISIMGTTTRRRHMAFRLKSIAVLTTISIPLTILYDFWTATGMWLTISGKPPINQTLWQTYSLQVPFTALHILSSLIFVPIFGTIFLYYLSQPSDAAVPSSSPARDAGP